MALRFWASQGFTPSVPNGLVLNVTDNDLLRSGGVALTGLPANGTYFSSQGVPATYTGTVSEARWVNLGNWDSVKNFKLAGQASDLGGRSVYIANFVHVVVDLERNDNGQVTGKDVEVTLDGVKRGEVHTGNGNDAIVIGGTSNTDTNPGFSDVFEVNTGAGKDCVIFQPASAGSVKNSPYINYEDGHSTTTNVDLGNGNDIFNSQGDGLNYGSHLFKSADNVFGGSGNDQIYTGDGNDCADGGTNADYIDAGDGNDIVVGGTGVDTLYGGNGNDTIDGGTDNDYIEAGDGDDEVDGGTNADTIEGNAGNDVLDGNAGNDLLYGNDGNDAIHGGNGADTIVAGTGNDTIHGGAGNDRLTGDSGSDRFVYLNETNGTDTLLDFEDGIDIIDITAFGITQAQLDSNTDGFVTAADAMAVLSGGDLKVNVAVGTAIIVDNFTSLAVSDFDFA